MKTEYFYNLTSCDNLSVCNTSGTWNFTTTEPNPWGMVELNYGDSALQQHILDAVCHWVDRYKVDGFRFDYIPGEPYGTWIWLKNEV